ncbi:MAG: response regulator transcription factor [Bacteroidales bacterium]|jgi:DNA-binding response OmpR family regulator
MDMRILIIEDEPKVVAFLSKGLEENGYEVEIAYDGQIGERLAMNEHYDLILLDVIIPQFNGLELCKRIREKNQQVPILILTALGTTDDKVNGFDAGADDYLVKPFEFKELLARIKALTKRTTGIIQHSNKLKTGDLELDLNKKMAKRGDKTIELTAKEFSLLQYFMQNKGRVVTRSEISEKVWDISFDTGTNVVDVYVNILRKKIEKGFDTKLIHTRIGMGYIFEER